MRARHFQEGTARASPSPSRTPSHGLPGGRSDLRVPLSCPPVRPPRLTPDPAGLAPLAAIKWLVKEMQVSAGGRRSGCYWRRGVCAPGVCASQRAEGRGSASQRASAGAGQERCSAALLPAPPHPKPAARARGAAPLADSFASQPRLGGGFCTGGSPAGFPTQCSPPSPSPPAAAAAAATAVPPSLLLPPPLARQRCQAA